MVNVDISKVLSVLAELKERHWLIVFGICLGSALFALGRYSVNPADPEFACTEVEKERKRLKGEVTSLKSKNTLLDGQVTKAQDSCDTRLRTQLTTQLKACSERVSKKLKAERDVFLKFKCDNCKRLGKCK